MKYPECSLTPASPEPSPNRTGIPPGGISNGVYLMQITINLPDTLVATIGGPDKAKADLARPAEVVMLYPSASLERIFMYGWQRIHNDAGASGKTMEDSFNLALKRNDNLAKGIMRASSTKSGDPVKTEAIKLVTPKIAANATFISWMQTNGLKLADKEAQKELRRQADLAVARVVLNEAGEPIDNQWIAQARVNVAATKALTLDVELDLPEIDLDDETNDESEAE